MRHNLVNKKDPISNRVIARVSQGCTKREILHFSLFNFSPSFSFRT